MEERLCCSQGRSPMGVHTAGFKDQSSLQHEREEGDFHLLLQVSCLLCHSLCSLPFFNTAEPPNFNKCDLSLTLKCLLSHSFICFIPFTLFILRECFDFLLLGTLIWVYLGKPLLRLCHSRTCMKKNPTLSLGIFLSSALLFISFSAFLSSQPIMEACGCRHKPRLSLSVRIFLHKHFNNEILDKWHLGRWLGVKVS